MVLCTDMSLLRFLHIKKSIQDFARDPVTESSRLGTDALMPIFVTPVIILMLLIAFCGFIYFIFKWTFFAVVGIIFLISLCIWLYIIFKIKGFFKKITKSAAYKVTDVYEKFNNNNVIDINAEEIKK